MEKKESIPNRRMEEGMYYPVRSELPWLEVSSTSMSYEVYKRLHGVRKMKKARGLLQNKVLADHIIRWWARPDLNRRPSPCEGDVITPRPQARAPVYYSWGI